MHDGSSNNTSSIQLLASLKIKEKKAFQQRSEHLTIVMKLLDNGRATVIMDQ